MAIFSTPNDIKAFQAITLKHALLLYAKTGMKVNKGYTPTKMLKAASLLTGKTFKRGQFEQAAKALEELVKTLKKEKENVHS